MNTAQANNTWALEIETAAVSTLWQEPVRCSSFLREIDPLVHLTQPHLRLILEAVNLAYGELGDADFATVVQVVREIGAFEEVGGLDGLNAVYSNAEHTPDALFAHYVETLKIYAAARNADPPRRPVTRFTGGKASLYLNKAKRRPNDPDYLGEARIRGHGYRLRGWLCEDREAVNITLEPQ
jgi:hypothetical protein